MTEQIKLAPSKIICKECLGDIKVVGSRSQPIFLCKSCGIQNDHLINTHYLCKFCKQYFPYEKGNNNYDDNGIYFICEGCEHGKI